MKKNLRSDDLKAVSENDLIYAESALITEVQIILHGSLEKRGVSRSDLAKIMGKSEAYISQMFSDNPRNFTLKTIARVFKFLGEDPHFITDAFLKSQQRIETGECVFESQAPGAIRQFFQLSRNRNKPEFPTVECNDNDDDEYEYAAYA